MQEELVHQEQQAQKLEIEITKLKIKLNEITEKQQQMKLNKQKQRPASLDSANRIPFPSISSTSSSFDESSVSRGSKFDSGSISSTNHPQDFDKISGSNLASLPNISSE